MSIPSITYQIIFIPGAIILYYLVISNKSNPAKNIYLLLLSVGFYLSNEPIMVALLLVLSIINILAAKWEFKSKIHIIGNIIIGLDVFVLFFYKYINYFMAKIAGFEGISKVVIPFGISYYIFNMISFILDSRNNKDAIKFVDSLLYISFFAKISSGPVVQYSHMDEQLKTRTDSYDNIGYGLKRFTCGLIKKVMIADMLAPIVTSYYNQEVGLSVAGAWIGAISYSFQLYYDFSGCTDMAIGIAKVFGFELVENFNFPYIAKSISDFWRRWHISLTKWFTKYLYIPLGGNRVSVKRHIFNMVLVWFCTGIWHGANSTFLVWAALQCVVLIIEKYTNLKAVMERSTVLGHLYTLCIVIFSWMIFRSNSIVQAGIFAKSMLGFSDVGIYTKSDIQVIQYGALLYVIAGLYCIPPIINLRQKNAILARLLDIMQIFLAILYLLICLSNAKGGVVSLYANF